AAWVDAWCQEVKTLTGVTPIIYCNGQFAALLQSLSSKYDLWIAKPGPDPSSNPGMAPWNTQLIQYSWNGSVSGVDVPVDMDVFQGNQAQFLSRLVIPGNSTPPPPFFATSSIQGGMFTATVAGLTPGETMI